MLRDKAEGKPSMVINIIIVSLWVARGISRDTKRVGCIGSTECQLTVVVATVDSGVSLFLNNRTIVLAD